MISPSRGAAGGASPERTVRTHGLGERSALSGARQFWKASRASPYGAAGRGSERGLDLFGRFDKARGDDPQRSQ
jgi:hypothetical protein